MGTNYAHIFSFYFKICVNPGFKMALWPTTIKNSICNEEQALDMLTKKKKKRTNLLNMSLEWDWWIEHAQEPEGSSVKMLSAHRTQQVPSMGRAGQSSYTTVYVCLLFSPSFFPLHRYSLRAYSMLSLQ